MAVNASFAGDPAVAVTVNAVLALVSPPADTVIVAVPSEVGMRLDTATPGGAATGDGLNEPVAPTTENVTGLVAVNKGTSLISAMVAIYVITAPTWLFAFAGTKSSFAGGPAAGVIVSAALSLTSPAADTVTVAVPVVVGVSSDISNFSPVATTAEADDKQAVPVTENTIGLAAVVTVLPLASWMIAV